MEKKRALTERALTHFLRVLSNRYRGKKKKSTKKGAKKGKGDAPASAAEEAAKKVSPPRQITKTVTIH